MKHLMYLRSVWCGYLTEELILSVEVLSVIASTLQASWELNIRTAMHVILTYVLSCLIMFHTLKISN